MLDSTATVRLRFFDVSGGLSYDAMTQEGLPAGKLKLQDLPLKNGKQKGGDGAGGGMGAGGAIFNQGDLTLERVTLTDNTATGGAGMSAFVGGGGMGEDGQPFGDPAGEGFGGPPLGKGGRAIGPGGGGFRPVDNASAANVGGGFGLLGGGLWFGSLVTGTPGDGGTGNNVIAPVPVGGGFGGGGGGQFLTGLGGFGGGSGGGLSPIPGETYSGGGPATFGGGAVGPNAAEEFGGGGGGMGGAIFNHRGTLTAINVTMTANTARGGNSGLTSGNGSGYGGAIFNLNGTVTLTSSTLAANTVAEGGGGADNIADGGALYNLAYGNKIEDGTKSIATTTISNSILANSVGGRDLINDKRDSTTTPAVGAQVNTATVTLTNGNLVMTRAALSGTTNIPAPTLTTDPMLGTLAVLSNCVAGTCKPAVLPLLANSPAINAATGTSPATDQTGTMRPQGSLSDLGAYERCCTLAKSNWPALLPNGTIGTAYAQSFAVTGASGTVTWSVTGGSLPNGLMLSSTTGTSIALTGTPTSANTFSFTLNATDTAGCVVSQMYSVTVNCPVISTLTISGDFSYCSSGSTTLTASGMGTFMWFKDNNLIAGQSTNTLTVTAAGSYTVKVTNANGCNSTTSEPAVVTSKPLPSVTPVTPAAICTGATTNIALSSNLPGATFNWTASLQSGTVTGFSNSTGATIAQTLTGSGVVKYSVTATLNGCPGTPVDILQTVNATVTTTPLVSQTVCEGNPVSFTTTASGTGPFSFVWKKGATTLVNGGNVTITTVGTTSTLTLTNVAVGDAGSYSVEVTGACNTATQSATLAVNTLPTITDPADQNLLQGGTASFSVTTTGTPAPTVQWQVSVNNGPFTDIAGATNPTLTIANVTPALNGNRYRAVASNTCGTATSRAATLNVSLYSTKFADPLVCLMGGDLVTVTASITNNGGAAVNATYNVTNLAPNLIGIPGSGVASIAPANFVITATTASWNGTLQAGETVNFSFKAQIAANVPTGAQVCITSTATLNNGAPVMLQPCTVPACPPGGVNPAVSAQKPGSLLVFPYYTSNAATKADTRFTLTNVGAQFAYVHLFFIDGASCQPSDQFLCLTPNASYAGKASETDAETTGWILAVVVNAQGLPIQANQLIGHAFVNEGEYVGNYGAEALQGRSPNVAAIQGDTALLFLDGVGYDAVPNQLAVEVQSPLNAPNQRVVTVGLRGDLNASTMTGAAQIGTGLLINGNETPIGSFISWLNGSCQAIATITNGSPRVVSGMNKLIPSS